MKFFRTMSNKCLATTITIFLLFIVFSSNLSLVHAGSSADDYQQNSKIGTLLTTADDVRASMNSGTTFLDLKDAEVVGVMITYGSYKNFTVTPNGNITPEEIAGTMADITIKNRLGSGAVSSQALTDLKNSLYNSTLSTFNDSGCVQAMKSAVGVLDSSLGGGIDYSGVKPCASKITSAANSAFNTYVDKTVTDPAKAAAAKAGLTATQSGNTRENQNIPPEEIYCVKWNTGFSLPGCIAITSYFILYLSSWILFVAALAFDYTIPYSLSMHDVVTSFSAIQYGWEILRNLINLFFILILVYISIATILQIENYSYKKLLGKLVIAAFLINFSMFFTEIIIDVSNITALVFYKQITIDAKIAGGSATNTNSAAASAATSSNNWISFGIMQAMGLSSVWNVESTNNGSSSVIGTAKNTSNDPATNAGTSIASQAGGSSGVMNPWTMSLVGLGGSVFVLILSFIFFAATILFLLRTVTLIVLIITSPAAFASRVLPKTSTWWDKWWGQLTKNALFAPVYMMLMFITLKMIWAGSNKVNGLMSLFVNGNTASIQAVIFFILLCSMLIMCLTLATSLGVMGSKTVTGWGKSLGGTAKNWSRNFAASPVSRLADMTSRSTTLSKLATSNSMVGRFIGNRTLQGADGLAKAKFGGSSSYRDRVDAGKKSVEARAKLSETNLKKLPGESDKAYYDRTGFRTGDLKKKDGETDAAYTTRVDAISRGMTADGYKDGDKELQKSIALASGVKIDDKGKPVLGTYLTRGAKLAAQAKAEDITKKAKKDDGSATKQLEKLRQRLFKPADPTATGPAASPSGEMLNMSKYLKSKKLKRYANDIASKTHAGNVDDQADKMRKLFEIEHSRSMKKRERLKQDVINASAAADAAVGPRAKMTANSDYQRKANDLSILQAEIDETDKKKTELGSFLSKVDDLKLAQSQLDAMSGINTGTPPPPKP